MTSGRTGHWTKMHQSLVKFSESEASNHTPSLADFTTTTPELKFSVHTTEITALAKLAADIEKVADDFDQLYLRAVAELPAWPRTQFEQSTGILIRRTDQNTDVTEPNPQPPSSGG